MRLFSIDEVRRIKNRTARRTRPVLAGDTSNPVSTAGLIKHAGRPNSFGSGDLGVAIPLHGNPDEIFYVGPIGT